MNILEDMDVWIRNNETSEEHFHQDVEVDFVIDGGLDVTVQDKTWHLKKNDVILLNSGISHRIVSTSENTVHCCAKFSCLSVAVMSGREINLFSCNSAVDSADRYQNLRHIFYELIYMQIRNPHRTACLKQSQLYKLLDCLLEEFLLDKGTMEILHSEDLKMMHIFQYINQNFACAISLGELADQLYMSKSTLSRFFKKHTGTYFADYVTQIRLQNAVRDLRYSDKNITLISGDSGFSSPSAFNKVFRETYGITPTEYRAQLKEKGGMAESIPVLDERLTLELEEKLDLVTERQLSDTIALNVKETAGIPFPKTWAQCINLGSASSLTGANLQYHTLYVKEHLGFRYARIWSVFSRKLMISDGRSKGYYNYDEIDAVLDFLTSNQMIPYLDFANRPNVALFTPLKPVFDEPEYIPFASKEIWQDLLDDFIRHIVYRYGRDETSKWIFEFNDEHYAKNREYYQDENYDFFDVFSYAYRTIKKYIPGAQVGGPLPGLEIDEELLTDFLNRCGQEKIRPDFISYTLFPYETVPGEENAGYQPVTDRNIEKSRTLQIRTFLAEHGFKDCRLYLTEWNNTLSNRNYLNDSCYRAAYIVKTLSDIADQVDMANFWVASDWISSYYDTRKLANGGAGLLTKDSIRKPAFFALRFLNRMGTTLLGRGGHHLITRHDDGSFHILCFNYKWFGANYFFQHEENFTDPTQIFTLFEDERSVDLTLELSGLRTDVEYMVKMRTINKEQGSILAEWKNLQFEPVLQSSDIKYIRECCYPGMRMQRKCAADGTLSLALTMLAHEITLIHIYEAPAGGY